MAGIFDMAKDLGNALARTDEYQNLKRASDAAEEDRDLVDLKNRIQSIEAELQASLQSGQEPSEELRSSYAHVRHDSRECASLLSVAENWNLRDGPNRKKPSGF